MSAKTDLRRQPRVSITCMVNVRTDRGTYPGLIRNISKTGFALETRATFYHNEENEFDFELPGGPKLKVKGVVMRISKVSRSFVYGIKIMPLSLFSGWRLQSFLKKHLANGSCANTVDHKATL
jgi:hypothetical protein